MVFAVGSKYKLANEVFEEKRDAFSLKLESFSLTLYQPFFESSQIFADLFLEKKSFQDLLVKTTRLVLAILCLPLTITSYFTAGLIDLFNFKVLNKKGYSFLNHGFISKQESKDHSILSLNACMLWGALPNFFGGVKKSSLRIDHLASLILYQNPDVLFLQEMSRDAGFSLWKKIKQNYSSAISSISPQPFLMMDASLFIATKQKPISIEHIQLDTPSTMRRSVLIIEMNEAIYMTTHLEAGSSPSDQNTRKKQVSKINEWVVKFMEKSPKPIFVLGDFNLKRTFNEGCEYQSSGILDHLINLDEATKLDEKSATCTNFLTHAFFGKPIDAKDELELVDFAFCSKKDHTAINPSLQKIETYSKMDPSFALSDHKALHVSWHSSMAEQPPCKR